METQTHSNSETENKYPGKQTVNAEKKKVHLQKKEYRQLFVSFAFMILLTMIAFLAVANDGINNAFAVPFILLLACVQVVVQLFIFMHLNEKGSEFPISFIFTGIFVAVISVAALVLLIWW